tara:strand:+ start:34 stop:306 length:273 start_codon:yes stop_codon:yes gene_type:complete
VEPVLGGLRKYHNSQAKTQEELKTKRPKERNIVRAYIGHKGLNGPNVIHLKKVDHEPHKQEEEKIPDPVVKKDLDAALKSGYFGVPECYQ